MHSQLFEKKLEQLYSEIEEFSEIHPEKAKYFNLKSLNDKDPYLETLLHGIAYIASNIENKLEEMPEEANQALLRNTCKKMVNPYSSRTVAEISLPDQEACIQFIKADTLFEEQGIYFKPLWDCQYVPIQLKALSTGLEINLNADLAWEAQALEQLLFYVHSDYKTQQLAYAFFKNHPIQSLELLDAKGLVLKIITKPKNLSFDFPYESYHTCFKNAQEFLTGSFLDYFLFRDLFAFYELKGLNQYYEKSVSTIKIHWDVQAGAAFYFKTIKANTIPLINNYIENSRIINLEPYIKEYQIKSEFNNTITFLEPIEILDWFEHGRTKPGDLNQIKILKKQKALFIHNPELETNISPKKILVKFLADQQNKPHFDLDAYAWKGINRTLNPNLRVQNLSKPSLQYSSMYKTQCQYLSILNLLQTENLCLSFIQSLKDLILNQDNLNIDLLDSILDIKSQYKQKFKQGVLEECIEYELIISREKWPASSSKELFMDLLGHVFSSIRIDHRKIRIVYTER
ncbi:MAG: type VI secretion system baseplate subunit TssF [Gammaproteobacteria bacterium]